jgi:RNA-directed DNA polymerase
VRHGGPLTFSGDAGLPAGTLARVVTEVARDEGFRVAPGKTRVRRGNERQLVCGVVVNQRLNVPRAEYDRLKAILHDAARHGPAAANRDDVADFRAHLLGRIAWVGQLHPARGERLRARFDAIAW